MAQTGAHYCVCNCKTKFKAFISANTVRYRCPIEQVPTKDDVMIDIDIGINFHIGGLDNAGNTVDPVDISKFFYNFGPNRLEELMDQESDEIIRGFIKSVRINRVRDIRTELTETIRAELVTKFRPYGVVIEQISIMAVVLPEELTSNLQ